MQTNSLSALVPVAQMSAAWQELRNQRIGSATHTVLKTVEASGQLSQWLAYLRRHQPGAGEAFTRAAFAVGSTLPLEENRSAHLLAFPLLAPHMALNTAQIAQELRMWLALHMSLDVEAVAVEPCFSGYSSFFKTPPTQLRVFLEQLLFEGRSKRTPLKDLASRQLWPVAVVLKDQRADEILGGLRRRAPSGLSFSSLRHRLAQLAEEQGREIEVYPPLSLVDAALAIQAASLRRWLVANARPGETLNALVSEEEILVLTTGRQTASLDCNPLSASQMQQALARACAARDVQLRWTGAPFDGAQAR